MNNNDAALYSIGLCAALFLIFLFLKVANLITWSWLWVTAPLWIPVAIYVIFCALIALIVFLLALLAIFLN